MAEKRSIFEEIGEGSKPAAPKGGMIDARPQGARRAIRVWLAVLFAFVVAMIVVGGLTRLTDSGLSITEWAPFSGALPPISAGDWAIEFEKYQATPEYRLQNKGMGLAEFKYIFWWEWGHRQLGRVLGLVWAAGFAVFYVTKRIPPGWTLRLLIPGILGGLQGAIGWWMVHSGLTGTMVDVASYRLALHLGLAFVILGVLAWLILSLSQSEAALMQARRARERRLFGLSTGLLHFAFLQVLLGALVAGIDAGRNYTDWPLMAGGFLPPGPFDIAPWWRNVFENDGLVQFMHRMAGYLLLIFAVVVWRRGRQSPHKRTRFAFNTVLAVAFLQAALGVVTVLYSAPLGLAVVHQLGAVATWVAILNARHLAAFPRAQSVRE